MKENRHSKPISVSETARRFLDPLDSTIFGLLLLNFKKGAISLAAAGG
jgi:hypothetical protein